MQQDTIHSSPSRFSRNLLLPALLGFLVFLVPLMLSTEPRGFALGLLSFAFLFLLPGYLLLTRLGFAVNDLFISVIVGITGIVTAYNFFAHSAAVLYFLYLLVALSLGGAVLAAVQARRRMAATAWHRYDSSAVVAGAAVALGIAPLYWRSGRFSGGEFVLQGPTARDPLFHVTLVQRLLHHVPPDNFIVAGLRAPVYHYFDDLTLAFVMRSQDLLHFPVTNLFDLFYRCYPTLVYFLLGALAYRAGKELVGSFRGGVLAVLLLLGGGGLGWTLGLLQTLVHAPHLTAMREIFFTSWTAWDGVDGILPLVHRPAHYHGLLISLAALNLLLGPGRDRRHWILAGLLLGLMAGFNFTLAATFGLAAVLGWLLLLAQHRHREAQDLGWLAGFLFIGSLPVTLIMLLSGFHNPAPGFPFRGPNLEFPTTLWGPLLGRMVPPVLLPWASLVVFPIFNYGIRLFGIKSMVRFDLGEERHRGVALVLLIAFAISFLIGTFFPYNAFGGQAIIFIQPTLWILAFFSLLPMDAWLKRNARNWRALALWGALGLTWMQALASFHFSNRVVFSRDVINALEDVRSQAAPEDVVAFLPTDLEGKAVLGRTGESTNFAITALTGLDGYFSSQAYSKFSAVPGLRGRDPDDVLEQAEILYEKRRTDVESFLKGDMTENVHARLINDHVRWIVVSGVALQGIQSAAVPWRKSRDLAVYRIIP
jgi:hypothetical protein